MRTLLIHLFCIGILLVLISNAVTAQVARVTTEEYLVGKKLCKSYIYDLSNYLISKGLYAGYKHQVDEKGKIERVKKKLQIGGEDYARDYEFIIELLDAVTLGEESLYYGDFGIIEVGYKSMEKATEVYHKAKEACKKYPMNILVYVPPFRCVQVGKNVLFVYSIRVAYDKYRDLAESWQPGMK